MEDINVDLNVYLFSSLITPLFFYSAIITQAYFGGKAISALSVWFLILIAVAIEGYFIFKLVNLTGNYSQAVSIHFEADESQGTGWKHD